MLKNKKVYYFSLSLFVLIWTALAFQVHNRADWLLENLLVVVFILPMHQFFIKGYISLHSAIGILIFLGLHSLGAHFTYSLVPYEAWAQDLLGVSINQSFSWQRNHYDRLIHFLWGLFLFLPFQELIAKSTRLHGRALSVFAYLAIVGTSTFYELIEWLAALIFGGDLGVAYVGSQGDPWDAQKDQALACLGALFAFLILKLRRLRSR